MVINDVVESVCVCVGVCVGVGVCVCVCEREREYMGNDTKKQKRYLKKY